MASGRRVATTRPINWSADHGIHFCHVAALASIHCLAASSSFMLLFVIASATEFWSAFVHWKFLMNVAASPAVFSHSVRTILFRV